MVPDLEKGHGMGRRITTIIGGVDTHTATHHAAVIDFHGRLLGDAEFPATSAGYAEMLTWMRRKGNPRRVGVEGTGAYGAGLARYLHEQNVEVLEVPRPDRRLRRQRGKSDPIDAEAAARTVLAGKASGAPKLADGPIEAIRMLRVARLGAVKAKTAAIKHSARDGHHRPRRAAQPARRSVRGKVGRRLRTAATGPCSTR